jgi:hypothetical protein
MVKIKKIAKWAAPISPNLDKQLEEAMSMRKVKEKYETFQGNPEDFKRLLRGYIERRNDTNSGMRKFALGLDSANKGTVPLDSVLDFFSIMGGVGTGARAIKTIAMSPGYLAYDAYYLGKTHDIKGTLGNVLYEGASWLMLGSLPHLINHYTHQADVYSAREGAYEFLDSLEQKTNIIDLEKEKEKLKEKKKQVRKTKTASLEQLSKAA